MGRCLCALLAVASLAACSPHAASAPRGDARSPYWIADKAPAGFSLNWAWLDRGHPWFHYEQIAPSSTTTVNVLAPSVSSVDVFTDSMAACSPRRELALPQTRTTVRGHPGIGSPEEGEGHPYGWWLHWAESPSRCVGVLVSGGGEGDVAAARQLAYRIAAAARPTTYAYFRTTCTHPTAVAGNKIPPRSAQNAAQFCAAASH